ncbi:LysR family transcriptional regulator [Serratia sp. 3ACOL1]|uniref:LysR family transcriptional regulator n=1 Tax=Serratia sp. 3ACOL1 TaxID=2448483 RepID=UPI000EF4C551|nr:LysR family transcriptional regulator [Serratia sp. 3ACOL1]AYM91027.1 LysR family transcriptional regulator [Serratia sp. 3ACOL1]
MAGENFRDIAAFLIVARERSFTRAAAQLGVSQSALSHTIRSLETRLGLRLLTRTTRSVSPTEAGERLVQRVGPRLTVIADELAAFSERRNTPAGNVRITTSDFAWHTVLRPRLSTLQKEYPDIKIEIAISPGLTDIVTERFDAGIRFGDQIAKDMTTVRISADVRMAMVAAPAYLEKHPTPREPTDLQRHSCINMRFSTQGGIYAWELQKGKRHLQIRTEGPWIFNCIYPVIDAAVDGFGIAFMPQELAQPFITNGRLLPVLKDWCPTHPGLHIYYASKRQLSPALALVIEYLRYRPGKDLPD